MLQVVVCIGYYKVVEKGYFGGIVFLVVGLIWFDFSKGGDWFIFFLVEQIVYEYIYIMLFIVEMVCGMYIDVFFVLKFMVVLVIWCQKRGYDKFFYVVYVVIGFVVFYVNIGSIE